MSIEQVGRSLQRLAVQSERFVLFSFAVQLTRLLHELDRIGWLSGRTGGLRRDGTGCRCENGAREKTKPKIRMHNQEISHNVLQADRFVDRMIASNRIIAPHAVSA